ncbi:hypothetical protein GOP47_0016113 [Adiantum capillus-veneris]|uniref:Uncharacterized protein n=1 Tax=Adiantum capillus-veneris TaxID=13818 RepID=A0A9D4UL89_ADICA|nr:hypothetical protein GOP47_0016113 [Adiantum capillus-veneris]
MRTSSTYLCMRKACAAIGAMEKRNKVHAQILMGLQPGWVRALLDVYAKWSAFYWMKIVLEKLSSCLFGRILSKQCRDFEKGVVGGTICAGDMDALCWMQCPREALFS